MAPGIAAAEAAPAPGPGIRRIQPSRRLAPVDFAEMWRYRELLYFLTWRDVKARYKQTLLSGSWAILRPLASMVIMAAVFGGLAGIDSGSAVAYPLFLYAGILPWTYFSSAVTGSSSSLVNNAPLISKAYFPRIYAPLATVTAPLVDFVLAFSILLGLFAWYRTAPSWHIVFFPAFVFLLLIVALGVGLWLAGTSVKYRDVPFALPFVLQIGLFVTPIIYPVSLVPEEWRWLLALNPLTGVIDGARWSLLDTPPPELWVLGVSLAFASILVGTGVYFFRWTERTIADLV